jgi:hypothetical protein
VVVLDASLEVHKTQEPVHSVGSVAGLIVASVDDTLPFAPENKIQTI